MRGLRAVADVLVVPARETSAYEPYGRVQVGLCRVSYSAKSVQGSGFRV